MKLNNNDDSHNSGLNLLIYNMLLDIESHPAWVCGLKLPDRWGNMVFDQVTPCVGVWIETSMGLIVIVDSMSHPAWVCGLKLRNISRRKKRTMSHPAWVCGLKQKIPRTLANGVCHTLRGCVD